MVGRCSVDAPAFLGRREDVIHRRQGMSPCRRHLPVRPSPVCRALGGMCTLQEFTESPLCGREPPARERMGREEGPMASALTPSAGHPSESMTAAPNRDQEQIQGLNPDPRMPFTYWSECFTDVHMRTGRSSRADAKHKGCQLGFRGRLWRRMKMPAIPAVKPMLAQIITTR